jgi:hypothetical protein
MVESLLNSYSFGALSLKDDLAHSCNLIDDKGLTPKELYMAVVKAVQLRMNELDAIATVTTGSGFEAVYFKICMCEAVKDFHLTKMHSFCNIHDLVHAVSTKGTFNEVKQRCNEAARLAVENDLQSYARVHCLPLLVHANVPMEHLFVRESSEAFRMHVMML